MTQRTKKLLRPRWIAVGLLVAVTAAAAALVATTTATSADAIPFSNPAHPVVDTNWIYDHNWYDANNFIYKVAGSDGCLAVAHQLQHQRRRHARRQQQPATELQRRAGVLLVVEGRRHDPHAATERQARPLDHRP